MSPDKLILQARTWLGTKYQHQGRLKKSSQGKGGADCIGLIIGIINELQLEDENGVLLSTYDETNYTYNPDGHRLQHAIDNLLIPVPDQERQYGDILLFKFHTLPQHIGILSPYNNNTEGIIHCTSTAGCVVEQPLSPAWEHMITAIYRFPNLN